MKMNWFNNQKISTKLFIGFISAYIISAALWVLSFAMLQNSGQATSKVLFIVLFMVAALIVTVLIVGLVSKSISQPLKELAKVADKLSSGDMEAAAVTQSEDEIGNLAAALNKIANNIKLLSEDASMLVTAVSEGRLDTRTDILKYNGEYKTVVSGVNRILDIVVDKNTWYEAIIDAVPFPIHVTDNDMKWTYMNKAFEKLMIEQGVVKERKDGYGRACSNAGANICNTQNCGIKQLLKGKAESYFDWCGMSCKQDTSYLKNKKGESAGFVEVVTDLTSILKVNEYTKNEVERLADNLNLLAQGNLDMNLAVGEADQYTAEARENFVKINSNLAKVKSALNLMISDADILAAAAVDGRLSTRADVSKHQGDYRKVVNSVNDTLDAIEAPLTEAKQILEKIAYNDYTMKMNGQYQGMFREFTDAINHVHTRLLSVQDAFERVGKGDSSRLEEFEKMGKRSENDRIIPACTAAMRAIRELVDEAGMLADAAVNGNLDVRGDAGRFQGGYKEIIDGINKTIDAIAQPIHESLNVMEEMAKGNLTMEMDGDYKGDYGKIKDALNLTVKSFNDVLNDINYAASQVASGARQVSDSAQALSQGSTEQASSIEELTASIEEISAQTKQNAENADEANKLAASAKGDAVKGNDQMKEMLKAMADINEASTNISKIIKVIDEIAFQTNILALNAAVEAARAGQHGKGFAVVAEEVRNLAARSANAAKETTVLIEGSIKMAETGTRIANNTAEALKQIVDGVTKAANLVGEIAVASNEQATGIFQVNQGIMQVSDVTQTNSATSEESAAASEELSSQAEVLREQVSRFNIKKSHQATSSYRDVQDLNPDVPHTLEHMNGKKRTATVR
jgi:Methyl-accepting chemotaxis protein